ncbi:NTP transferase domain-containing protein [Aestuariibaculum sediminum]|uniref:Probable molybdenum cofactor guanylyltransferase n=1 Tax=Aestuariibaculum sediminum TaxID=2770637 RepID=A0A8J6Q7Q1_9FLAO|nr:NTP transferase domain-containing protein [Aestuariibaculum sediminum]MBD0832743.1 NTP transferase domain-containing protein [Aestuariibaculum sediminum]
MIEKNNITGIILSGGKSSRMGSDKGLLYFNGKPFTQHIIEALEPLVSKIIIVSNTQDYDKFKYQRVKDVIEDAGPLAGLYSGLKTSKTEYNLVLSCDIPLIKTEILRLLINQMDNNTEIIQFEAQGKTMPLIAIYKSSCADTFFELLKADERRLQYAVNQCKLKTINLATKYTNAIINVNTPNELKYLKMQTNIKYFGQIAEVTQVESEIIEHNKTTVSELLDFVISKYPQLKQKEFKIAQNKVLVPAKTKLTGEEIALLPPFAGG